MSSHTLEGKKKTQNGVKRLAFTVLSILLEVVFLIGIFKGLNEYAVFIDNLTRIFAVILVLKIYGRNETSSMKTPWIILILTFPILGVALYFMIGMNGGTRKMRMRYKRIDEKLLPLLLENKEVLERLNVSDPKAGNVSNYIERNACYPVYQNTDVTYFDEAVKGLEAQLTDLAKAEQFIFMEYHAIEDEYAWSRIQTVLEERVKAGVEVRVFYDDMGSIGFVNLSFARKLEAKGIACRVFNPLLPGLNMFLNNRDHRKITVIDGKVGYTGGYNLVQDGVRIYEWTPGFCHAKMSVADDCMATCGTINLDYRSLYHHFENGCFMADCDAVLDIRRDMEQTLEQCREVTEKYKSGRSATLRLGQLFLRLFAELL